MATQRKLVDKEALGVEYRAGMKSLKMLGEEFGISAPRVKQIADAEGWERDLSVLIRQKAEAKLNAEALNNQLNADARKASEREIVEVNATVQANKITEHRTDIKRYRTLCQSMLAELEAETGDTDTFEGLGELLKKEDASIDKLNEAYRKAISLPSRIDGVKKLADTLKVLIGLERQAFGIADNAEGDKPQDSNKRESDTEIARKVAFALALGLKEAQK